MLAAGPGAAQRHAGVMGTTRPQSGSTGRLWATTDRVVGQATRFVHEITYV